MNFLKKISCFVKFTVNAVSWIRIRMDPELLPGSGFGIIVPDPDPAKYERADKSKCYFSLNSGLRILPPLPFTRNNLYPLVIPGTVGLRLNIKWQILDRFFFMIEFRVVLFTISKYS